MKSDRSNMIALGVAMGVAIGVATHNVGVWIAIGAAIGIVLANNGKKNNCGCDSADDETNPPQHK